MKKLMTVVVAIGMAVVANAAAITWGSGTVSLPSGTTAGKDAVAGYLFMVDATTYGTYSAYTDAAKLSTDIYAAYKDSLGTADNTKSSTKKGAVSLDSGADYGSGTYYAVVLYTTTEGGKDYFMGNYASATIESTMDVAVADLALKMGGTGDATSWQSVPEPTSGLLMLLGMAGLALRRRRA